jgi:Xaa-Pro aminopeptidase
MKTKEIREFLRKNKLDAIVLFSKNPTFSYFLGGDYEHGILLITRKENLLFLSPLYSPKIAGFKVVQWKKFKDDFRALVKKKKIKVAGVDLNNLFVPQKRFLAKHFKLKDASRFLASLRVTKEKEELDKIRQACKITDEIFSKIVKDFNFKTEYDIARFIKLKAFEKGAEMAFEPIAASGKNAAVAHHEPDNKPLNKGFLVLDFGAKYNGYMSDMSRTIYLGVPTRKEIAIYEKLLSVQETCIEKAGIGLGAGELHMHAVKLLGKDAKYFTHSLGHGFGVEIHELPNIGPKSKELLKKGTVITIEPGYYDAKAGIGIRIEDDLFLGGKKEILTRSPKNLICIKGFKRNP